MLRVISLGAGVQSTTMLLMGLKGLFGEPPDAAIFADTGWEPAAVYAHLDWLEREVAPFPIHRVARGNIRESFYVAQSTGKRYVKLPTYVRMPEGDAGLSRRQCTKEFKIEPIQREVRRLLAARGIARRPGAVEQWIGISLDEISRMKPARVKYITHRWPLIEQRMSRQSCLVWLKQQGYPQPPRSACIGCPFHSNHEWRQIREHPEEWQQAVEFDQAIRTGGPRGEMIGENYLHRSLVPLDQVDFSTAEERGQVNMFENECEGMCGV